MSETQALTDQVLNIKFTLEKLQQQKQDLEVATKTLATENARLMKSNEDFDQANKTFEEKLQTINAQIKIKEDELASSSSVFKDEIDKQFKEIEGQRADLVQREKAVVNREAQVSRDIQEIQQQQTSIEKTALDLEAKEKMLAVREVEIKQQSDNQTTFHSILQQKEEQVNAKDNHNKLFETSLLEREQALIGKTNTIAQREAQLIQLKNAVDNDKVNHENEKHKNSYVLKVLESIQNRCITNVGQKITEIVINGIREKVLDIYEPVEHIQPIVDKNIAKPAPVVEVEVPAIDPVQEVTLTPTPQHEEVVTEPAQEEPIVVGDEPEDQKPKKVAKRKIIFKNKTK